MEPAVPSKNYARATPEKLPVLNESAIHEEPASACCKLLCRFL